MSAVETRQASKPSLADIQAAAARLKGIVNRTPVLRVAALDERAGAQLFIKCENLQRAGAFKIRGAYNRLTQLNEEQRRGGVVAYSSGNHAQGVALAAKLLGISATIVMPSDAGIKLESTKRYGAKVVPYDRRSENREEIAQRICTELGATLVPPYDDYQIMAGQGTATLELLEDYPDLDALLVPIGGGGLLSGSAVAAKAMRPAIRVYGVEPETGNDWRLSWERGERTSISPPNTIADGLRVTIPGELTWPVVRANADGVLTVSDNQIRETMRLLAEHAKIVVEPSGTVGVAAAVHRKAALDGKKVGIIISGGNIDRDRFCRLLSHEPNVS